MDAKALTARDLFDPTVCYEIPPFQRPYVWTEEDQWQPLWDDVARLSESLIEAEPWGPSQELPTHFLGAIVLKALPGTAGDPSRFSVIDGQQRITTLQLLLDAAQIVLMEEGDEAGAESLQELVSNGAKRFQTTHKRFKLWPSRIDRTVFEQVMDNDIRVAEDTPENRIANAHSFFREAILQWARDPASGPGSKKLQVLSHALQQQLQMVAIDLSGNDDDQLIFETLNDRGTPLLAADLIKNFIFQKCEDLGADVDSWSEIYWQDFDEDWWRDQVAQGRLFRSRIDLFLQYWLTMRVRDEIPTDAVFSRFRKHAASHLVDKGSAETFLLGLRRDADTFRSLADVDPHSALGNFYFRVVESLELGAFIPLLLWLVSENRQTPKEEADAALEHLESWAVRRTLLRWTMKDVNKLVVAILRELEEQPPERVGQATKAFLLSQTADSRKWPTDDEVVEQLPNIRAYGSIKQSRLRTILATLELKLRTERHEAVSLPTHLEIEHVMPQGWASYWGADVVDDPVRTANRNFLVQTVGNLTLVTQKLNKALSHRPWTDAEAIEVAPTGPDAGLGKRTLLNRFSLLQLNKDIVERHPVEWSEEDISSRSRELAALAVAIWPIR